MSKDTNLEVAYQGTTITYVESADRWEFILRGRNRHADSLAKAKEFIDKPEPTKRDSFIPVKGFMAQHGWGREGRFLRVRVTSVEGYQYGNNYVWVMTEDNKRSKENAANVIADTPENVIKVKEYEDRAARIAQEQDANQTLMRSMARIELPNDLK